MGRHSRSTHPARHAAETSPSAANYVGRVGALALALGIGVAVASGTAVAHADGTTADGSAAGGQAQSSAKTSVGEASSSGPAAVGSAATAADEPTGSIFGKPGTTKTTTARHSPPVAVVGATKTVGITTTASHTSSDDTRHDDPAPSAADRPSRATPTQATVAGLSTASTVSSTTHTGDAPVAPAPDVLGALQLIRRETEGTSLVRPAAAVTGGTGLAQPDVVAPVAGTGTPSPTDVAHTAYGDIGTWLIQPNGQIANYGGVPHDGKTVLEPVNVIILDPSSTTAAESAARLDAAMTRAGFPAQPIHSVGFSGIIDGTTYGQQPAGFLQAFSDNFFLFPNDHGRVFGAAPAVNGTGYVWSGAFSTEQLNPANPFTHEYVSSDVARAELARRLVASGAATVVGVVPLGNAYDDGTFTTGDHDGYAVVLQLTPGVVAVLPTGGVLGAACGLVDDLPGPVTRQLATAVCVVAAQVSNAFGLRSII
ncbi:hypothetical protein H7J06_15745 [Mycobacterium hodleri]|uniref:hypothetical protein n=1 Tax=Mycolicibacterium hodleri TaxID=49897 RepID=UPI0021F3C04B|nr:hypothetical protein [Mycolicibacterium hodleri]MCV7134441.1 hypothetical protein [Mycolicibacterium hodleri]